MCIHEQKGIQCVQPDVDFGERRDALKPQGLRKHLSDPQGTVVFMVWYLCTYAPRVCPRIQQYQLNRYSQTGCGNHYRLLRRNSLKPTLRVSITLWVQLELSNSPLTGAYPMLLYCFESKLNDKKPNCLWDTRDTEDKPAPATKTTFVLHSVLFW